MEIIPSPEKNTAAVLDFQMQPNFCYINPYAGIRGSEEDSFDYTCGACGVVVAESSPRGSIRGMVIRCSNCRSYNELRGS